MKELKKYRYWSITKKVINIISVILALIIVTLDMIRYFIMVPYPAMPWYVVIVLMILNAMIEAYHTILCYRVKKYRRAH